MFGEVSKALAGLGWYQSITESFGAFEKILERLGEFLSMRGVAAFRRVSERLGKFWRVWESFGVFWRV